MFLVLSIYLSATKLIVNNYTIKADVSSSIRIVHLTDLHNHEFGRDNNRLIEKVAEQSPDLIFMTGDMLNQDEADTDTVCTLISGLSDIAPVYYGYGNHENDWEYGTGDELRSLLEDAGATVLDVEYTEVTVNGQELRIGGMYAYYRQPHMTVTDGEAKQLQLDFADDFENTEKVKLLLCHIPTAWLDWGYIDKYPVDVVFSGHYHGGQVRIPFVGGLYAPYAGMFPEYTKGVFEGESATCVLSAGLGKGATVPRINNLPEITVVDLVPINFE